MRNDNPSFYILIQKYLLKDIGNISLFDLVLPT